jgi:hypothetical protein
MGSQKNPNGSGYQRPERAKNQSSFGQREAKSLVPNSTLGTASKVQPTPGDQEHRRDVKFKSIFATSKSLPVNYLVTVAWGKAGN